MERGIDSISRMKSRTSSYDSNRLGFDLCRMRQVFHVRSSWNEQLWKRQRSIVYGKGGTGRDDGLL